MAFKHQLFRVSDLDLLTEWDLGKVLAVGDSIPAYRYSASELLFSFLFRDDDGHMTATSSYRTTHHFWRDSFPQLATAAPIAATYTMVDFYFPSTHH